MRIGVAAHRKRPERLSRSDLPGALALGSPGGLCHHWLVFHPRVDDFNPTMVPWQLLLPAADCLGWSEKLLALLRLESKGGHLLIVCKVQSLIGYLPWQSVALGKVANSICPGQLFIYSISHWASESIRHWFSLHNGLQCSLISLVQIQVSLPRTSAIRSQWQCIFIKGSVRASWIIQ